MIMIDKADSQLIRHGPLLDSADKQIDVLLDDKRGEFARVRIVDDNDPRIAQGLKNLVVLRRAGLRTDHGRLYAQMRSAFTRDIALNAPPTYTAARFPLVCAAISLIRGKTSLVSRETNSCVWSEILSFLKKSATAYSAFAVSSMPK